MRAAPWIAVYRWLLAMLPAPLRDKHGDAMVALYARELARAQSRGAWHVAMTALAGVRDLLMRSTVERLRPRDTNVGALSATLRPLGVTFATSLAALTIAFVGLYARRTVPMLADRGASVATITEALLLAVPFTMALTLPMAVLLAVLLVCTGQARREAGHAVPRRRAVVPGGIGPVLAAATAIAALALVVNTQVVPRANERLSAVLSRGAVTTSDRSMTVSELQAAARAVQRADGPDAAARVAAYKVEIHKKFALAAACLVLAVVGIAIAHRAPAGGTGLVVVASLVVYAVYFALLTGGETLADQRLVSPAISMWGTNALLLSLAMLALWRRGGRDAMAPTPTA